MPSALLFILTLATVIQSSSATPETQANPLPVKVPRSADAMLKLAAETNGLDETSARPWHIRLTYDHFDSEGDNDQSGTVEEFYGGPKKYKRIVTSDTLNQTDVADGSHLYRTGDQGWPGGSVMKAVDAVLHPLRVAQMQLDSFRPEKADAQFKDAKLPCITLRASGKKVAFPVDSAYCFNTGSVMLRFSRTGFSTETKYDNPILFQGRYVAKDISMTRSGKAYLRIHVEELSESAEISESFFSKPEGAGPIGGRIAVPADAYIDYLISTAEPDLSSGDA